MSLSLVRRKILQAGPLRIFLAALTLCLFVLAVFHHHDDCGCHRDCFFCCITEFVLLFFVFAVFFVFSRAFFPGRQFLPVLRVPFVSLRLARDLSGRAPPFSF